MFFCISYMGCHPSHWRTHTLQDGYCTTNQNWYCEEFLHFFPTKVPQFQWAAPAFGFFNDCRYHRQILPRLPKIRSFLIKKRDSRIENDQKFNTNLHEPHEIPLKIPCIPSIPIDIPLNPYKNPIKSPSIPIQNPMNSNRNLIKTPVKFSLKSHEFW